MSSVLILGPEEPHPTKKSRVGKLHLRDDTVLGEKDTTVADPSATDIPHQITAVVTNECTFRLWGAMSGPPRVWGTTKMLLPSSYCKWRKVPRCRWTSRA